MTAVCTEGNAVINTTVGGAVLIFQPLDETQPVQAREIDVAEDEVEGLELKGGEPRLAAFDRHGGVSRPREHVGAETANTALVVNDQDALAHPRWVP